QGVRADRPERVPEPEGGPPGGDAAPEELATDLGFGVAVDPEIEPLEHVPEDHRRRRRVQAADEGGVRRGVAGGKGEGRTTIPRVVQLHGCHSRRHRRRS
ncbi:hypothetical protein ACHAWF_012164, partial [Thalassiosira exigua]